MKHTECKDCELSNGDCGYHFKMDGTINYDIASLSACDKYGNCEFFKSKSKPKGDIFPMKIVAGKCPIEAGGNCPLRPQGEWVESHIFSCGKILRMKMDVIEHKCKHCGRWSIKWVGTIPDNFCSYCGASIKEAKNND